MPVAEISDGTPRRGFVAQMAACYGMRLNLPEDAALLQGQSMTASGTLKPPAEAVAAYYWDTGAGRLSHRERKRVCLGRSSAR